MPQPLRVGSVCTGYGGMLLALRQLFDIELAWYSEIEKHPSTLLAQRFPEAPNLGDLKALEWGALPAVDILTGGYPCQPFSTSGKRQGENDPRHLWPHLREAIRILRPSYSIFENVSGHRSMGFADVLRDCAEDGLDVRWVSVPASDVGAPHQRDRIFFIVFDPAETPDPTYHRRSGIRETRHRGDGPADSDRSPFHWGEYEPYIRRWELLTRPAPFPYELNSNGKPRLTVAFSEWMMGLPAGWINDIDIPYGAKIRLGGNGGVPQAIEYALRVLFHDSFTP